MATAMIVIAAVVIVGAALMLTAHSAALRRLSLAACGAAQLAMGIAMAGALTWCDASWAAEPGTAASEEVFFQKTTPVSVEPGKTVIIPPGRPAWVAEAKQLEPGANWTAVVAGPCETRMECEKELSNAVKAAADEYINNHLGSKMAAQLLNYDGAELKTRLVSPYETYGETIQVSFGPMEQLHARLSFTDDFRRELDERWREIKSKWRLAQVGLIGAVVLGLLSTAFGFFKANTRTHGQRGSTLQFAAAATILVIVVAGVTAARYLYWF